MTDRSDSLHNPSKDPARLAADLLQHYSFELAGYSLVQQIAIWLEYYPAEWLPFAIIEALYQGRYKAISVEQILNLWERRQQPVYHFNHEFERLICGNLPYPIGPAPKDALEQAETVLSNPALSYRKMLLELPSIQAASRLERLSEIPSLKLAFPRANVVAPVPPPLEPVAAVVTNGHQVAPIAEPPGSPKELMVEPNDTPNRDREFQDFQAGVVFGLSSGLAVASLKPGFRLAWSQLYHPNWMAFLETPAAIAPFTPERGSVGSGE